MRHGVLLNVYGTPARSGDFIFMPAYVELDGGSSSLDDRFRDQRDLTVPPTLRYPIAQGFDAAWVRARIPNIFGFTPEPAEVEKALIDLGFVAAVEDGPICYPFRYTDHYGKSALVFSNHGPEEDVRRSIAGAFWSVLVREPAELSDFEQRVRHASFGCRSGHVYRDESIEI